MTMSDTLSPVTAPRDKAGLMKESPFKLRILVQQLGGLSDDAQKMAWHGMQTPEQRADYVLTLLQAWDAANPGASKGGPPAPAHANGATPHQPAVYQPPPVGGPAIAPGPTQHQPVTAPQVAHVSPQAAQQAQAATTTDPKPKRNPRTSSDAAAADVGADAISLLTSIKAAIDKQNEGLEGFQKGVMGILEEATAAKTSRVTAVENKYDELASSLRQLNLYLQSISNVQLWNVMMMLTFMQEQMGLPMVQVLKVAIEDSATFQKLVDQATGKV
jgi:hypothetical protein